MESMSQYPPQYGMAAAKERAELDYNALIGQQPSSKQIELSVLKGLWFPIMTGLTNLSLDKSSDKQTTSISVFFQVLKQGVGEFSVTFWHEILSQVFFPMLEDIDLAIQTSTRKGDEAEENFYLTTVYQIVQGFNDFLIRNIQQLSNIIPIYADILVLFISQTQNRKINQTMIVCYNQLMSTVGPSLDKEMWHKLTNTYMFCFEESIPGDLMDLVQQFLNISQVNGSNNNAAQQIEKNLELALSKLQV